MNMTLKETLELIKTTAESIAQVMQIELMEAEQIEAETTFNYPLIIISPSSFSLAVDVANNSETINVNVVCTDRLLQDKSNLIDCWNNTHEIIKDLTSLLYKNNEYEVTISQSSQQIVDQSPSHAAGWMVQYTFTLPYEVDIC